MRKRIALLPPPLPPLSPPLPPPPPLPPLLLLPLPPPHRMLPRQLRHYYLCSSSGSSGGSSGGSSSGLRWCKVAAAADSRMPSLTPAFCVVLVCKLNVCHTWQRMQCLLSECLLHVAQNTMSRVLPSGILAGIRIPLDSRTN